MKINLESFDDENYLGYKHSEYRNNLKDKLGLCNLCNFHRGENRRRYRDFVKKSWKQYRKTQYKTGGKSYGIEFE